MTIILCGLPLSGKSTTGKLVANHLDRSFIDTDILIEQAYTKATGKTRTCREIYQEEGHVFFRELEKVQIERLEEITNSVLAVGGGALLDSNNRQKLSELGSLIYLKADPKMLWKRVKSRGVPAYLDGKDPEAAYYEMAEERMPVYEEAADFVVDVGNLDDGAVCAMVCELVGA